MPLSDLISTIVQKRQLDMAQAAQELAKQQLVVSQQGQKAQIFDALSKTLPNLNPDQRRAYALGIAQASGLDDQTAVTAADAAYTSPDAYKSAALEYYIKNNPTGAMSALGEMAATGRTPGQASQEGDYISMTPEEHAQAGRIQGGVALSAGQQANVDVGNAGIKQNYKALENQWNIAQLEYQARIATAKDPTRASALLGNLSSLLRDASQGTNTVDGRRAYNAAINAVIEQLAQEGIVVPINHIDPKTGQQVLGLNPDGDLKAPGFFGAMKQLPGAIKDRATAGRSF